MGETEAFVLQLDRLKKSHQEYSHKTGEEGSLPRGVRAMTILQKEFTNILK